MRKIPTVFVRDPEDMRYVTTEVHPDCQWVLDGEGVATRKYDGTCVMLDEDGNWWARREVKPGKTPPPNWVEVDHDETTGKRVGWEPSGQSSFAKFMGEALAHEYGIVHHGSSIEPGTYELIGPKINGNPEGCDAHVLVAHGYEAAVEHHTLASLPRDFDGLREALTDQRWEGVVWHHPDGRMAKLKRRDFPTHAATADTDERGRA